MAILDANRGAFLRPEGPLIQTLGRPPRHIDGHVIMYADTITRSMKAAMDVIQRRRSIQEEYNEEHGIDPQSIRKKVSDILLTMAVDTDKAARHKRERRKRAVHEMPTDELERLIRSLEEEMHEAAKDLRFEYAARLRDEVQDLGKELTESGEAVDNERLTQVSRAPERLPPPRPDAGRGGLRRSAAGGGAGRFPRGLPGGAGGGGGGGLGPPRAGAWLRSRPAPRSEGALTLRGPSRPRSRR